MVQNWQSLFLPNCTGKVSHEARPNLEMGKRTSSLNERSCKVTLQEAKTHREVGKREPFCNLPPELYFFIVKVLHHNNGIESKDLSAPLGTNPIADFFFCFNPFCPVLEKEMTTHFSILGWKTLWMEEPDRLQSKGSQRVRHDWATRHTFCRIHNSH